MNMAPAPADALGDVHAGIAQYYTGKVNRHGPTPAGVDWACSLTQDMRFVQLLKLCDFKTPFSLNDLGCGYGALASFICRRHKRAKVDYWGIDLSPDMIRAAEGNRSIMPGARFSVGSTTARPADYAVASGIFNVKLDQADKLWTRFIAHTLSDMSDNSKKGFAVNFLAPLPNGEAGKPELYRTPPSVWQSYCEATFGVDVVVIENYGMREYTLLATHR